MQISFFSTESTSFQFTSHITTPTSISIRKNVFGYPEMSNLFDLIIKKSTCYYLHTTEVQPHDKDQGQEVRTVWRML